MPPTAETPNCLSSFPHNTASIAVHCSAHPGHCHLLLLAIFSIAPAAICLPWAHHPLWPRCSPSPPCPHPSQWTTYQLLSPTPHKGALHQCHGHPLHPWWWQLQPSSDHHGWCKLHHPRLAGHAFIAPSTLVKPNPCSGSNQCSDYGNHCCFLTDQSEHKLFLMISQELKKQLLAAVATIYLLPLQHETLGFAHVLCVAMLTHLAATYGVITLDQLKDNCNKMEAPWNPDDPIKGLWEHIRECQHLATVGGDPITAPAAVWSILDMLEKTGIFLDAIYDWQKCPLDKWTMDNFCINFTTTNKEHLCLLTTQNARFHGANNSYETTLPTTKLANITVTTTITSDTTTAIKVSPTALNTLKDYMVQVYEKLVIFCIFGAANLWQFLHRQELSTPLKNVIVTLRRTFWVYLSIRKTTDLHVLGGDSIASLQPYEKRWFVRAILSSIHDEY